MNRVVQKHDSIVEKRVQLKQFFGEKNQSATKLICTKQNAKTGTNQVDDIYSSEKFTNSFSPKFNISPPTTLQDSAATS